MNQQEARELLDAACFETGVIYQAALRSAARHGVRGSEAFGRAFETARAFMELALKEKGLLADKDADG